MGSWDALYVYKVSIEHSEQYRIVSNLMVEQHNMIIGSFQNSNSPFKRNGISHSYQLDQSIFVFRVYLFFYLNFS